MITPQFRTHTTSSCLAKTKFSLIQLTYACLCLNMSVMHAMICSTGDLIERDSLNTTFMQLFLLKQLVISSIMALDLTSKLATNNLPMYTLLKLMYLSLTGRVTYLAKSTSIIVVSLLRALEISLKKKTITSHLCW